jgi:adenine deaminase
MNNLHQIKVKGNIVDVLNRNIYSGEILIHEGKIMKITPVDTPFSNYILPGFTDAHIHIESSMLVPYEFARIALTHGTVSTVSDPHEIANVCGLAGIDYMIENARQAGLKINFGAPSCVPATGFETAGAVIDAEMTEQLLKRSEIKYLSEMMNYPGVLMEDAEVMKKIAAAKKYNKPVDGHAPGLRGEQAKKYIQAGISTDHECFTLDEALDKINFGMKILIREGSAAKNFEALHSLISTHPSVTMLCSDDKHPDDLLKGHINELVKRALQKGHQLFDVLQCACVNPVLHYKLNTGLLRQGDAADFIVVDNLNDFNVLQTWIDGVCLAEGGKAKMDDKNHIAINQFKSSPIQVDDLMVKATDGNIKIIEALDGQLITNCLFDAPAVKNNCFVSDTAKDILKIVVVNRYQKAPPVVGFVKNFGFKSGAIASTVAHDSHNIIAVGVTDEELAAAINVLMKCGGGLCAVNGSEQKSIALPVAGLMSTESCEKTGNAYSELDHMAKQLGSKLKAPFMTLSFMALLVIPHFKIGDKGLFDVDKFAMTTLN